MANGQTPNSRELRAELGRVSTLLAERERDLSLALELAETAAVDAILTGKPSKAPAFRYKAGEFEAEIAALRESHKALASSLQKVEQVEAEAGKLAERALVTELHRERRKEVATLIDAIERQSKAASDRVCSRLAALHFRYPAKLRPPHVTPGGVVREEQLWTDSARLSLLESVCQAGFSDLLPANHLARRRYEHSVAHDRSEQERMERERVKRKVIADASIIDETNDLVITERRTW